MNGLEKYPKLRFKGFSEPWNEIVIGDLFKVTRGYVLPSSAVKEEPQEGYVFPVFSSQTKNEGLMGYYNEYLYEDAITWTTDGANAGTVHYRDGKFYCTNVCGVLLNEEGNANRCVAEILGSVSKKYVSYVGNPKLMNNVMSEIRIHIPSVIEQKRIDEFLTVIDLRIMKQRELIEYLKKYKRGVLEQFIATFQSNNASFVTLKEVTQIFDGTHQTPNYRTHGVKFVSVENIESLLDTRKYISKEDFEKEFKIFPSKGDVLMTRIGDIGRSAYVDFEIPIAFYVSLALFKCKNQLNGRYLTHYIMSNAFQEQLWKRTLHIAFPKKINTCEIGECEILLPSLSDQIHCANLLDSIDLLINKNQKLLEYLTSQRLGILQKIFI